MRRLHRLWATIMGHFWLPCGRCGFEFGGHEHGWRPANQAEGRPLLCIGCVAEEGLRSFFRDWVDEVIRDYERHLDEQRSTHSRPEEDK